MPNNDQYDSLFDSWGQSLNVDPQLAKSVFQMESGSGQTNPANPMGIQPDTATAVAKKMGWDPKAVDVSDMRWAVPIGMRVLADGLNATQSPDGAVGYYNSGSADPAKWNQSYISTIGKIYPTATVTPPAAPQGAQDGSGNTQGVIITPPPTKQPPAAADGSQSPPPSSDAVVSTGASLVGNDSTSIKPFLQQTGQSLDPTKANWCAAFVNGVLGANGEEGTQGPTKNVATGFLNWGQPVQGDPQQGDVLVQPRGHPMGGLGGHVGIFTGQIADTPGGGPSYYLMVSGNYGGKVSYSWEPAGTVVARRAPQPPPSQQSQPQAQQQAAAQ